MNWIFILTINLILSVVVYSKRFTSNRQIKGLYFVQFYYLAIATPLLALSLIQIGLEIFKNKEVLNFPLSSDLLLSGYILSIIIGAIGAGIHSSSTSVSEAFKGHIHLYAFRLNEQFHGPLSHEFVFLAGAFVTLFIGLLGINHPNPLAINPWIGILFGALVGLMNSITVIRSTHVGISLLSAFFTTVILSGIISQLQLNLSFYPYVVFALSSAATIFFVLSVASMIYATSKRGTRVLIELFFPKGHPIHEFFMFV